MIFLKTIKNIYNKLLYYWKKLLVSLSKKTKKTKEYQSIVFSRQLLYKNIPNIVSHNHTCAPVALHIMVPTTPESKLLDAFYHCCEEWPNAGVKNKEFNIVIKYLDIHCLEYIGKETTIHYLLKQKKEKFIALIYGHYLVVSHGKIIDSYNSFFNKNTKVYCYWVLIQ